MKLQFFMIFLTSISLLAEPSFLKEGSTFYSQSSKKHWLRVYEANLSLDKARNFCKQRTSTKIVWRLPYINELKKLSGSERHSLGVKGTFHWALSKTNKPRVYNPRTDENLNGSEVKSAKTICVGVQPLPGYTKKIGIRFAKEVKETEAIVDRLIDIARKDPNLKLDLNRWNATRKHTLLKAKVKYLRRDLRDIPKSKWDDSVRLSVKLLERIEKSLTLLDDLLFKKVVGRTKTSGKPPPKARIKVGDVVRIVNVPNFRVTDIRGKILTTMYGKVVHTRPDISAAKAHFLWEASPGIYVVKIARYWFKNLEVVSGSTANWVNNSIATARKNGIYGP